MVEAFPLAWPQGYPRTNKADRFYSQFKCTLGQARDGVLHEIQRLGGINPIISTNIPVKKDGMLYASAKAIDSDPGVAVYFTWKNDQVVLACDQYVNLWENLRAIEKSIEAMRGLERWGCSDILNRTFSGFKALPETGSGVKWWEILDVSPGASEWEIQKAYKRLAKERHPDATIGSPEKFQTLTNAYRQALAAKGEK